MFIRIPPGMGSTMISFSIILFLRLTGLSSTRPNAPHRSPNQLPICHHEAPINSKKLQNAPKIFPINSPRATETRTSPQQKRLHEAQKGTHVTSKTIPLGHMKPPQKPHSSSTEPQRAPGCRRATNTYLQKPFSASQGCASYGRYAVFSLFYNVLLRLPLLSSTRHKAPTNVPTGPQWSVKHT